MTPAQIQKVGLSALLVLMTCSVVNAQTYGLDKDCKGVPMEVREQIRTKAEEYAGCDEQSRDEYAANDIGTPGAVRKSMKAWAKGRFADVPDECTARITGEVIKKAESATKTKIAEAKAADNEKAWNELTDVQKLWLIYSN